MKQKVQASKVNRSEKDDLTICIGRETGTGRIWLNNQLGNVPELHTDLSLADLGMVALELEALGDDEAAEFVRNMVECIEHTPLSEALEASYRFPVTTSGQLQP